MKKKFLGVFCSVAMIVGMTTGSALACTKSWGSQATAAQKGKCAAQTVSVNNMNQFKDAVAKASTLGNCSMTIDVKATIEINCRINIAGNVNLMSSNGSKIKAGKEFCKGGNLHGQSMFNVNKGGMFNIGCGHNVSCDTAWGKGGKVDFGKGGKVDIKGKTEQKGNCSGKANVDIKGNANGQANTNVDVNANTNVNAQTGCQGDGSFKAEGNLIIDGNNSGCSFVNVCDKGQAHIANGAKIENVEVVVETEDAANKDQCVGVETNVNVNGKDVAQNNFKETYVKAAKDAKVVNEKAADVKASAKPAQAKNLDNSPKTGDSSNIWVAVGVLGVAAAGIVTFIFVRKRKTV